MSSNQSGAALPTCARDGCRLLAHSTQGHGFCCKACKDGKGHGAACQGLPAEASAQPRCSREGCLYLVHSTQGHSFCCNGCKAGKSHGSACERRTTAPPPDSTQSGNAPAAATRLSCAREDCQFLAHSKQNHGFCCGGCKDEKGHGARCERSEIAAAPVQRLISATEPQPCAVPGCQFAAHSTEGHEFCCLACKGGKGHEKACEQWTIVSALEDERPLAPSKTTKLPAPCAREGCQFLAHSVQEHGFCCGSCKSKQGHGGQCQRRDRGEGVETHLRGDGPAALLSTPLGEKIKSVVESMNPSELADLALSDDEVLLWCLRLQLGVADDVKDAREWLESRPEMARLFLFSGDAPGGGWHKAAKLLHEIAQDCPAVCDGGPKRAVAVAVALVFAEPRKAFADGSRIEPLPRYRQFCAWLDAGELYPDFAELTPWQMRYVVGSWAKDEELVWARSNAPAKCCRGNIGVQASKMVKYTKRNEEGVSVQKGAAFYKFRPVTLQTMHEMGGVCGAISKYSTGFCQAHGVPAMPLGQPGHCAFAWLHSPDTWKLGNAVHSWPFSHRHSGVHVTWGGKGWFVLLMQAAQKNVDAFRTGEALCCLAAATNDRQKRASLILEATGLSPCSISAWRSLIGQLREEGVDEMDWVSASHRRIVEAYAKKPPVVSRGAAVRASDNNLAANNAVSGYENNFWTTNQAEARLDVDLGRRCSVLRLGLQWWAGCKAGSYSILSSLDGRTYEPRVTQQDALKHPKGGNGWSELPGWDGAARFLRLMLQDGGKDPAKKNITFGLRQLQVTGQPTIPCTARAVTKELIAMSLSKYPYAEEYLHEQVSSCYA